MAIQVLVADDDPAILQTLSGILRLEGAEVTGAASARRAVEQLRTRDFDLVITDMRMETATAGVEVIRAAALHPCRPILIVITAFPLSRADVNRSGECNVIMKGSDPFALIRELRSVLTAIKTRQTAQMPRQQ
jgi:CheY-like chemotaxis protein